jgi:hypothetical protein
MFIIKTILFLNSVITTKMLVKLTPGNVFLLTEEAHSDVVPKLRRLGKFTIGSAPVLGLPNEIGAN